MDILKNKKVVAIGIILIILWGCSIMLYGKNNKKVFQDEYMKDIFVEEEEPLVIAEETSYNMSYLVVEIKGEVQKPDVYELEEGSIIKDLIDMAGGLTEEADISRINRAKKLQNHELIVIANKNDISNSGSFTETIYETSDGVVNINSATLEQLKQVNGIGDVKAQSIIDYREKNGGFKSIEEIKNIDGIGEKTFEKIKEKITL